MRLVFLDTETTGFIRGGNDICGPHRIVEIGCIEVVDGVLGRSYQSYVNPGDSTVSYKAMQVHGITDEFLVDKPCFSEIADELLDFISDSVIVMHNAPFDIAFLDKEFGLLDRKPKRIFKFIDTLPIFRRLMMGFDNSLDGLSRRFGIHRDKFHGAVHDAKALAMLFLLFMGEAP